MPPSTPVPIASSSSRNKSSSGATTSITTNTTNNNNDNNNYMHNTTPTTPLSATPPSTTNNNNTSWVYYQVADRADGEKILQQKRNRKSCHNCRASHIGCDGGRPCSNCLKKNKQCFEYDRDAMKRQKLSNSTSSSSSSVSHHHTSGVAAVVTTVVPSTNLTANASSGSSGGSSHSSGRSSSSVPIRHRKQAQSSRHSRVQSRDSSDGSSSLWNFESMLNNNATTVTPMNNSNKNRQNHSSSSFQSLLGISVDTGSIQESFDKDSDSSSSTSPVPSDSFSPPSLATTFDWTSVNHSATTDVSANEQQQQQQQQQHSNNPFSYPLSSSLPSSPSRMFHLGDYNNNNNHVNVLEALNNQLAMYRSQVEFLRAQNEMMKQELLNKKKEEEEEVSLRNSKTNNNTASASSASKVKGAVDTNTPSPNKSQEYNIEIWNPSSELSKYVVIWCPKTLAVIGGNSKFFQAAGITEETKHNFSMTRLIPNESWTIYNLALQYLLLFGSRLLSRRVTLKLHGQTVTVNTVTKLNPTYIWTEFEHSTEQQRFHITVDDFTTEAGDFPSGENGLLFDPSEELVVISNFLTRMQCSARYSPKTAEQFEIVQTIRYLLGTAIGNLPQYLSQNALSISSSAPVVQEQPSISFNFGSMNQQDPYSNNQHAERPYQTSSAASTAVPESNMLQLLQMSSLQQMYSIQPLQTTTISSGSNFAQSISPMLPHVSQQQQQQTQHNRTEYHQVSSAQQTGDLSLPDGDDEFKFLF